MTVRAELPGIDPKDLDVTVTGNQLVLSGEKKESSEHDGKDFYHSETRYGSFRRMIPLPDGVDTENVDAQYANGVLTLHLKKTAPAAQKRIEVKATYRVNVAARAMARTAPVFVPARIGRSSLLSGFDSVGRRRQDNWCRERAQFPAPAADPLRGSKEDDGAAGTSRLCHTSQF